VPAVVGEVASLLIGRERFRAELHREHRVGLLDDLLMEEREPDRLLQLRVALDLDVRAGPPVGEIAALIVEQALKPWYRAIVRDVINRASTRSLRAGSTV
jgi:hypothetical protein